MKVSVISPVYNSAPFIRPMIDSLLAQTMDDFEVIFVDDHGQDDGIESARAYVADKGVAGKFRFLQTPVNSGPGEARNIGMAAARGEYIAFVDSDDTILPDMLAAMTAAADAAAADFCYCRIAYKGGRRDGRVVANPAVADGTFTAEDKRRFLIHFKTFCVTFIYKRSFLEEYGLRFPPERSSEDTNFLIKVLLCGRRIASVQRPFYLYWQHGNSLTVSRNEERWRSKFDAFAHLMDEVKRRDLYGEFQPEIDYLYLKKCFLVGALNYLQNAVAPSVGILSEMQAALTQTVPGWPRNPYLARDGRSRLLARLLCRHPRWAIRILPFLLRRAGVAL